MCENLFYALLLYNLVHGTYIITGFFVQISAISSGASGSSRADTVLLDTRLRYGKISYKKGDVVDWKERWQPSERHMSHLMEDYLSTPEARVLFIADGYGGVSYEVTTTAADWLNTTLKNFWKKCPRLTLRNCGIIFFLLCLMLLLFWIFWPVHD